MLRQPVRHFDDASAELHAGITAHHREIGASPKARPILKRSCRLCHAAAPQREKEHRFVETVLTEWLSLILRWLHVVAGMAWIGSSFYFIHLDLSLKIGRA